MKKLFMLCLLLFSAKFLLAQDFEIVGVEHLPNDFSAREEMKTDHSERQCALLRIATQRITPEQREGFTFKPDLGSEMVERATRNGEIWLWVSPGLKYLRIMHRDLGQYELRLTDYVTKIESLHTYKVTVKGAMIPVSPMQPEITQQFLVFNVTPPDAFVTVDGELWPVNNGRAEKRVSLGRHQYSIEAVDYHTDAGSVEVGNQKAQRDIVLKPAFGYLKIEGDRSVLSQATVYVDKANGADALKNGMKLDSGQHILRVVHSKYKPYEVTVTIKDDETTNQSVVLDANYSTVTLKSGDPAGEIYVDDTMRGIGSWTGDLVASDYLVECRKTNHRPTQKRVTITDRMSGEVITLDSPTPITGTLVVTSNPSGAVVFIDGKHVDETPIQLPAILIGEHTLRLEKAGCAPLSKTFTIEEGKTLNLAEKLDTGRSIIVKTDRSGDKIYVDGTYVGETPRETPLGFGQHTVRVVRNGIKVEKDVDIKESTRNGIELSVEFGRLITIRADQPGAIITVDGGEVGTSPVEVDLPVGKHAIHAQRGKKYADKDIEVSKTGGLTEHTLVLHGETVSHFVKNGVWFATINGSFDFNHMAPSYGFCVGSVKQVGWFVTAMSNFQFGAMSYDKTADANGLVDGSYPSYSGKSSYTRISLMGGMVISLGGPVCLRVGAGYGISQLSMSTTEGSLVKISANSYQGVDATAGLQLNLKGFTISADAVTTNFGTIEAKVGLGYCWKRK
ncbi:MAG: PEGA domain-containing protein [Bacteroidales bacterium]|nr:PEGA domain-containing protein [Bacteroidales bacterium]